MRITDCSYRSDGEPRTMEVEHDVIGWRWGLVQELLDNLPPVFDVDTIHVALSGSVYVTGIRDDGEYWSARMSDHGSMRTPKQQAYLLRRELAKAEALAGRRSG